MAKYHRPACRQSTAPQSQSPNDDGDQAHRTSKTRCYMPSSLISRGSPSPIGDFDRYDDEQCTDAISLTATRLDVIPTNTTDTPSIIHGGKISQPTLSEGRGIATPATPTPTTICTGSYPCRLERKFSPYFDRDQKVTEIDIKSLVRRFSFRCSFFEESTCTFNCFARLGQNSEHSLENVNLSSIHLDFDR